MWENCGIDNDYLQFALAPWQWVTGGYFSMILVSVIIVGSYMKYHKALYSILIGILFIPISAFLFPDQWINMALVMMIITVAGSIWYVFLRQTKEY